MRSWPAIKRLLIVFAVTAVYLLFSSTKTMSAGEGGLYCTGSFKYDVIIEGKKMGNAMVTRQLKSGNYRTYSEIQFDIEGITTVTRETIVETSSFDPVSYETDAAFMSDKYISRLKLKSWYEDNYLYLNDGRALTKFRAGGKFYYSTNKMLASILSGSKIEGASASCSIFDPAVEMKKTLPARLRHVGNVTVNYHGKVIEAYRILADYGPMKKVEMTVDKNGIVYNYIFLVNRIATEMRLTSYAK